MGGKPLRKRREPSTQSSTPVTETKNSTQFSIGSIETKPSSDDSIESYLLPTSFLSTHVEHRVPYSSRSRGIRRGVRIQQWTTEKELGRGGFGVVYLQTEKRTGKLRAVKQILHTTAAAVDPLRELTAMAALSKDETNFVKLKGWYQNDEHLYIAMEYFEHGDLRQCITGAVPEQDAQVITFQVTEALQFMHARHFAHRDLKPSNIFVAQPGPNWWVKVADFGISKCHNENTALHTLLTGDSTFAAPEMMGYSDDTTVTNAVDMWSLGSLSAWLVVHECLISPQDMFKFSAGRFDLPFNRLAASGLSSNGVDFVSALLVYDPGQRLTAQAAVQHEWLTDCIQYEEFDDTLSVSSRMSTSTKSSYLRGDLAKIDIETSVFGPSSDVSQNRSPPHDTTFTLKTWPRKGTTKMPRKKVHRQALLDLGYQFSEEDPKFFIVSLALGPEDIDAVYERSEQHFNARTVASKPVEMIDTVISNKIVTGNKRRGTAYKAKGTSAPPDH